MLYIIYIPVVKFKAIHNMFHFDCTIEINKNVHMHIPIPVHEFLLYFYRYHRRRGWMGDPK